MNPTTILALISAVGPALQGLMTLFNSLSGGTAGSGASNAVTLLQTGLNALQAAGEVQFEGQAGQGLGSPLTVDGQFGGRTFAAIKALQAKFGFAVQEPLASLEMEVLQTLLSKL